MAFEWDLRDIDGATHFLDKNLVGFERDLLHGMFVSQQWQWQSSEDYPSLQDTHIYSIYIIIYNTIQYKHVYSTV